MCSFPCLYESVCVGTCFFVEDLQKNKVGSTFVKEREFGLRASHSNKVQHTLVCYTPGCKCTFRFRKVNDYTWKVTCAGKNHTCENQGVSRQRAPLFRVLSDASPAIAEWTSAGHSARQAPRSSASDSCHLQLHE